MSLRLPGFYWILSVDRESDEVNWEPAEWTGRVWWTIGSANSLSPFAGKDLIVGAWIEMPKGN